MINFCAPLCFYSQYCYVVDINDTERIRNCVVSGSLIVLPFALIRTCVVSGSLKVLPFALICG